MKTACHFLKKHFLSLFLLAASSILFMPSCKTDPMTAGNLRVFTDTIIIQGEEFQNLKVENTGRKKCQFQVLDCPAWLIVHPIYAIINPDEIANISLGVDLYSSTEVLTGNALKGKLIMGSYDDYIAVTVIYVPERGTTYQVPDTVRYPSNANSFKFAINNYSNQALQFSVTTQSAHIQLPSPTGQIAPFGHAAVEACLSGRQGHEDASLLINVNGQNHITALIEADLTKIEAEVVDADYSKASDLMVCALNTNALAVYHASDQTINEIRLPYIPTCVALSLDGTKALVGHKQSITYVDLLDNSIIYNREVNCEVYDLAIGSNQWAYIFPAGDDSWQSIHSIDLSQPYTSELQIGIDVQHDTHVAMHPSGSCFYIPNNLSPESIQKFDIQENTPRYIHEVGLDNTRPAGDLFWCSDGDERLFTTGLSVFKTSDNIAEDLDYLGQIEPDASIVFNADYWYHNYLTWLDHNSATQRIYLIPNTKDLYYEAQPLHLKNFIYINDGISLRPIGKIGLDDFITTNSEGLLLQISNLPRYVFSNSDGSQIHVLSRPFSTLVQNQWELQTINIE